MAAVAALGARRGNCWCIGTSLDAQGLRGRVTAPGPDLFGCWFPPPARGFNRSSLSLWPVGWSASSAPWSVVVAR
jgi:hypothetical protein